MYYYIHICIYIILILYCIYNIFLDWCFAIVKHTLIWLNILYFLTFQLEGYQYHSTSILLYIYYILFYYAFIHISLHITVCPVCIMYCVVDPDPDLGLLRELQICENKIRQKFRQISCSPSPPRLIQPFWIIDTIPFLNL